MLLDSQLIFSDAQAVTEDAASTNFVDTQVSGRAANELWFVFQVETAFDSAGDAATLEVQLQTDDNSSFSSPTTLCSTGTLTQATLIDGYRWAVRIPEGCQRYLRAYYNNATEAFTAGKADCFLTGGLELN